MLTPDAGTRLIAVLGHPIGHSLSPVIHNAAFAAQGLRFAYLAFDVREADLEAAVTGLRALGFAGANVTLPHKRSVSRLVDHLTPEAGAAGAVNTLVPSVEECRITALTGDNTDVAGFAAPLVSRLASPAEAGAVVFGAGGAARAVVFALCRHIKMARITIAARRPERAEELCTQMERWRGTTALKAVSVSDAADCMYEAALVVNTTPLGMQPTIGESVWHDPAVVREGQIWYDLVYNPVETAFLRLAGHRGAVTISGMDMFIGQAAASYAQWTGRDMPLDVVRSVLRRHLR